MNRIQTLFHSKNKSILNVYCTAGFPGLDSTIDVLNALQNHGADMIEIGIPYSDPLADGPVIQQSNMVALKNGMTIKKLFEQLNTFNNTHSVSGGAYKRLPLILMGYLNPVLQYGIENFCEHAKDAGVDGIILPDLPLREFETEYKVIFERHQLAFVFLITPETSVDRIKRIDDISTGFIYAVSSSSTTGKDTDFELQADYFKKLKGLRLKNPVLVGFGIRDNETFKAACEYTNGAIIGSAYIKGLQNGSDIDSFTKTFLNQILK